MPRKWIWIGAAAVAAFVVYKLVKKQPLPLVGSLFTPGGPTTPPAAPFNVQPNTSTPDV